MTADLLALKVKVRGRGRTSKVRIKEQNTDDATFSVPRSVASGKIQRRVRVGNLGSQFEMRSVGPRSSIEDSFLVVVVQSSWTRRYVSCMTPRVDWRRRNTTGKWSSSGRTPRSSYLFTYLHFLPWGSSRWVAEVCRRMEITGIRWVPLKWKYWWEWEEVEFGIDAVGMEFAFSQWHSRFHHFICNNIPVSIKIRQTCWLRNEKNTARATDSAIASE